MMKNYCHRIILELSLSNTKKRKRIVVNPVKKEPFSVDFETLDNFQNNEACSNNQMKKVCNLIRSTAGRSSIPPNYQEHMQMNSKTLESFYKHDVLEFEIGKDETGKIGKTRSKF